MAEKPNEIQVGGGHYQGGIYQHWDFVLENHMGYLEGQITRYICRWRNKNGQQDLQKALHYANKLWEAALHDQVDFKPPRRALSLLLMMQLYRLTPEETEVFRLAAEWSTIEALVRIRELIQGMIV